MQLTEEQRNIINSQGDIKINAVAGSGKTTTIIEYAKSRPAGSRILYLAFNKSVKLEAVKKFAAKGLKNVTVETAHSLAFGHIVFRSNYKIKALGYSSSELVSLLELQGNGEKHTEFVLANHISKLVSMFCNSACQKVQELNYPETITDENAKKFVHSFYPYIVRKARILLDKMNRAEIEITHDFYLKKFQLTQPELHYDYLLFDEGQDASAAMLDIFLKQKATKVIVGDTHQQIYGWRYAVNSLEKTRFKTYQLSTSFRFSQNIAKLAIEILKWKEHISKAEVIPISGKGANKPIKTKAILARTNLGLLLKAIEYITNHKNVKQLYFEGNINSYTYADEGASLYDVLNLYNGKHYLIKDRMIKSMESVDDLEDYIEKTEDIQLGMMLEIVKEYGNKIPGIIKSLKEKHVENEDKDKAEIIFSTVHRCKGMEYDQVELVGDFITEERLIKLKEDKNSKGVNLSKLNEEINLLYVAVTRTKNVLRIPDTILPKDMKPDENIQTIKIESKEEKLKAKTVFSTPNKEKSYSVDDARLKNKDAYKPWTDELDLELTEMYCKGIDGQEIAKHFKRTNGAISSRIKKLGLDELYG